MKEYGLNSAFFDSKVLLLDHPVLLPRFKCRILGFRWKWGGNSGLGGGPWFGRDQNTWTGYQSSGGNIEKEDRTPCWKWINHKAVLEDPWCRSHAGPWGCQDGDMWPLGLRSSETMQSPGFRARNKGQVGLDKRLTYTDFLSCSTGLLPKHKVKLAFRQGIKWSWSWGMYMLVYDRNRG